MQFTTDAANACSNVRDRSAAFAGANAAQMRAARKPFQLFRESQVHVCLLLRFGPDIALYRGNRLEHSMVAPDDP
jgi:hypothetical protein